MFVFISAAMIHWTRQIKEVLSAQDALQTSENAGPLEEIDFWKNRFDVFYGNQYRTRFAIRTRKMYMFHQYTCLTTISNGCFGSVV